MEALAATIVLLLHGPDGREIRIAPAQVTSLHSPRAGVTQSEKLLAEGINCLVNLTDGKYASVVESCVTVQEMMEGRR